MPFLYEIFYLLYISKVNPTGRQTTKQTRSLYSKKQIKLMILSFTISKSYMLNHHTEIDKIILSFLNKRLYSANGFFGRILKFKTVY